MLAACERVYARPDASTLADLMLKHCNNSVTTQVETPPILGPSGRSGILANHDSPANPLLTECRRSELNQRPWDYDSPEQMRFTAAKTRTNGLKARAVTIVSQQNADTSSGTEALLGREVSGREKTDRREIQLDDPYETWMAIMVPYVRDCEEEAIKLGIFTLDNSWLRQRTDHGTVVLAPLTEDLGNRVMSSDTYLNYADRGRLVADAAIVALIEERRKQLRIARERDSEQGVSSSGLQGYRIDFGRQPDNDDLRATKLGARRDDRDLGRSTVVPDTPRRGPRSPQK